MCAHQYFKTPDLLRISEWMAFRIIKQLLQKPLCTVLLKLFLVDDGAEPTPDERRLFHQLQFIISSGWRNRGEEKVVTNYTTVNRSRWAIPVRAYVRVTTTITKTGNSHKKHFLIRICNSWQNTIYIVRVAVLNVIRVLKLFYSCSV